MASKIGIKIANGEFYPLVEENSLVRKKMVLTTVHDNQPSVQIDLYRSPESIMADAQYIGSLVVENIKSKAKGEPSIEMIISSDRNGDIIADAIDLDNGPNGEHYVLTVSLKSLDETARDMEIPDFELESNGEAGSGLYLHANKVRQKRRRKFAWLFILLGLIIILGLLGVWLFLLGGMDFVSSRVNIPPAIQNFMQNPFGRSGTSLAQAPSPVVIEPVSEPVAAAVIPTPAPAEPTPVIQAPAAPPTPPPQPARQASQRRPPPPVASYNVPATIPREGVDYGVRWGDTLWDISEAFYRDPWLYPRIARFNNIRNPNHIISGRTIKVPPKN